MEKKTEIKHEIKLASGFLQDILSGKKTFELRKDDRDYQEGDFVLMKELSVIGGYSGAEVLVRIKYVLRGRDAVNYGCNKGYCVWGFELITSSKPASQYRNQTETLTEGKAVEVWVEKDAVKEPPKNDSGYFVTMKDEEGNTMKDFIHYEKGRWLSKPSPNTKVVSYLIKIIN